MPDVFAPLIEDHRAVASLFSQFQQTGDPQTALEICRQLTVHAMVEEELVYSVLATKVEARLADEARKEHNQAKTLISQIESGVGRGEDVAALVQQLQRDVQHHFQEEEEEIFPRMQNTVPVNVGVMGEEVARRKEELEAKMGEALSHSQPPSSLDQKSVPGPPRTVTGPTSAG
jgi:hemerythrin superfamily protein